MKSEDVARLAGVSRSTVSRVINNYSNVPDETRERVMRVIREHDYVPNTSARVLAGKATRTLGLFLFNIHDELRPGRIYGNTYLGTFITAIVDRSNAAGYSVLTHTVTSMGELGKIQRAIAEKRIEGAILIGIESSSDVESLFRTASFPIAVTDYDTDAIDRIASSEARMAVINSDDESGIGACVTHLAELGHSRIGFMKGIMATWSGECRLRGYRKHMAKQELPIVEEWILEGDFMRRKAAESTRRLIASGNLPTAIIASNDTMALSIIETLHTGGYRVPEDISVIGYDDAPSGQMARPALSTIHVPVYEMAGFAVDGVLGLMDAKTRIIRTSTLSVDFIQRETCAPPHASRG